MNIEVFKELFDLMLGVLILFVALPLALMAFVFGSALITVGRQWKKRGG